MMPPQPSPIGPQFAFAVTHVCFVQPVVPPSCAPGGTGMNVPTGGGVDPASMPDLSAVLERIRLVKGILTTETNILLATYR